MCKSIERVRAVINDEMPDRAPLFDLLRNDAVISHFAGEKLTIENSHKVVYRAYSQAIDATRPKVRTPEEEREIILEDGRKQRFFRWTDWIENKSYDDSEAYESDKTNYLNNFEPSWNDQKMKESLSSIDMERQRLDNVFFFPVGPCLWLTNIYSEVGLEYFAYYLADCPHIIEELLESNVLSTISWVESLPPDHGIEAIFAADDIAFNSGPLLSPVWFAEHYFPRLSRVVNAYHKRGIKFLFHSDGNLNLILDDLVEAGIDGLNPIEILADMNVGEIHRRYPHLFLAGGIDVSHLLPYGSSQEVKDVVRKTIDAAEGRIMIGSSTELHDGVPLDNFIAMREAVLENPYH